MARTISSMRDSLTATLSDGLWHDGQDLSHPCIGGANFTGRIYELRQAGWEIETRSSDRTSFMQYRLVGTNGSRKDPRYRVLLSASDLALLPAVVGLSDAGLQAIKQALGRAGVGAGTA